MWPVGDQQVANRSPVGLLSVPPVRDSIEPAVLVAGAIGSDRTKKLLLGCRCVRCWVLGWSVGVREKLLGVLFLVRRRSLGLKRVSDG